jgi:ornithine carbamoyltransferase
MRKKGIKGSGAKKEEIQDVTKMEKRYAELIQARRYRRSRFSKITIQNAFPRRRK